MDCQVPDPDHPPSPGVPERIRTWLGSLHHKPNGFANAAAPLPFRARTILPQIPFPPRCDPPQHLATFGTTVSAKARQVVIARRAKHAVVGRDHVGAGPFRVMARAKGDARKLGLFACDTHAAARPVAICAAAPASTPVLDQRWFLPRCAHESPMLETDGRIRPPPANAGLRRYAGCFRQRSHAAAGLWRCESGRHKSRRGCACFVPGCRSGPGPPRSRRFRYQSP